MNAHKVQSKSERGWQSKGTEIGFIHSLVDISKQKILHNHRTELWISKDVTSYCRNV